MTGGIFFEEFEVSTEKYIGQPSDSHRQIAPLAYIIRVYPFEMSVWACAVFSHARHDVSWAVDIIYIPKWAKGKW